MTEETLKAPFPYFGGKSRIASAVWERLGDCPNYVEPFFGSGAVLLARPTAPRIETINDVDGMVSNFWRAVQAAPDEVAAWCDYPVLERDLEARHYWLVTEGRARIAPLAGDPTAYDAQVAGWWCWGLSTWIGGGWCSGNGPHAWDPATSRWVKARPDEPGDRIEKRKPFLTAEHQGGVNAGIERKRPVVGDRGDRGVAAGISRRRPFVCGGGQTGQGINAVGVKRRVPRDRAAGVHCDGSGVTHKIPGCQTERGIHAGVPRQTPDIGGSSQSGRGVHLTSLVIVDRLRALADRLRRVRVCSGDWSRICTPAVTVTVGVTGAFLDPPYSSDAGRKKDIYARDCMEVAKSAATWARENGDNPALRIAFCGYEGEHEFPASWEVLAWKANGGYGNRTTDGAGRVNAERERVWFSPHCLKAETQRSLFAEERA